MLKSSIKISTYQLKTLQFLHFKPIYVLVSYIQLKTCFKVNFLLRCFQQLYITNLATRRCYWSNNRYTRDSLFPVLSY
jgi:hypothetical protein